MCAKFSCPPVSVLLVLSLSSAAMGLTAEQSRQKQEKTEAAITKGVKFLLSQIGEEGSVKQEYQGNNTLYGGQTALTVYALLSAGVDPETPQLKRALEWLVEADLTGTYVVSLRASALAAWNVPQAMPLLRKDVDWLIAAAAKNGGYTYTPQAGQESNTDNSNSQFGLLGVWAGAQRGVPVPPKYWKLEESYWLGCQCPDGGWNYRPGDNRQSYGSMTAAGLASLFVTYDALHQKDYQAGAGEREYEPIAKALKWLEDNFTADNNPKSGNWWYYWLYSVERVAMASGYKYFGNHNWYEDGADLLLAKQAQDGYWDDTSALHNTNFAILFLARGRYPVLANKLKYRGRWNSRPRDLANLTRWLSWNFERPVSWQVVDVDAPIQEMHDAPILYISGAGACEFSDQEITKLRDYVLQGGLILAEASANSGDFTIDMQACYRRMLPEMDLARIPQTDAVYTAQYKPAGIAGLMSVNNGLRHLVIHSPKQLSHALQAGHTPSDQENNAVFELLANIYLLATDKGTLQPRGTSYWPKALEFDPVAAIRITPVKYEGNYNPEPLALERLAIELGNRYSVKLEIDKHVDLADLDAKRYPLAVMTGTGAFTLSEAQAGVLREFFHGGGTMIIDAAGGSSDFGRAVTAQVLPLPPAAVEQALPQEHAVFRWPTPAETPGYRRDYAMALGTGRTQHRITGVFTGSRLAIIYSPADLTAGLVGYQAAGLRGYRPDNALALMTNMVFAAASSSGGFAPRIQSRPTTSTAAAGLSP